MAWIKAAEQRGDVDWRQVKEVHDSFKYSNSGLGAASAMIIAIVLAYFTAGAVSGLATSVGSSATSVAGAAGISTTTATTIGTAASAATTAVVSSAASSAAISTINNQGDLGAVFKDLTSSDALRGYLVSGITAGLTAGLFDDWMGTKTGPAGALENGGKVVTTESLSKLEGIGRFAGNQLLQNGTSTVLDRALGGDSSFSDALRSSLANTFAAAGFNWVGDQTSPDKWNLKDGSVAKIGLHAIMGGLAAEAAGGDFKTGALAAGVNEALVGSLSQWYGTMDPEKKKSLLTMNSQVIGVLAAAAQGGDEAALQTGAWVAGTATQYNHLDHGDAKSFERSMESCGSDEACQRDSWIKEKYAEESIYNDKSVEGVSGPMLARDKMGQIAAGLDTLLAMTCATTTCQEYKLDLIGSALANYKKLSDVAGEWSPTLDRIGMVVIGVGSVGTEGPRPRPAGTPISVGAVQVEKALEYFSKTKDGVRVVGAKAPDSASNVALFERLRADYAAQEIRNAQPVGSALKDDPLHRAPSFVIDQIPESGRLFTIRGGDGKSYNLTQMEGAVDGKQGIFEWLVNSKGELTHQRFIPTGRITGTPNQVPSRLPR
ncbi:DUF637 domain-containing protein [Pseudomonas sichuanensis]|uniref:DUF637 domain-containing protein n=1 Tax=Pseudomonas sichuanensis TaxID=2213015 RepID=UPI0038018A72